MKTRPPNLSKHPSVEKAWQAYVHLVLPPAAPPIQVSECRLAFFAGAAALFYGLVTGLDDGDDATEADLAKMDAIQAELEEFTKGFDAAVAARSR